MNLFTLKVNGFKELIVCLISLIDYSSFAIKERKERDNFLKYKKELIRINKKIPLPKEVKKAKQLRIIEEICPKDLKRVLKIKMLIQKQLDKNYLIFIDKK